MPPETSDSVSLGEIDSELKRVQAAKEEHQRALAELEQDELRLLGVAHALREFLAHRRSRFSGDKGADLTINHGDGTVTLIQVKETPRGIVERATEALRSLGRPEPQETWPLIRKMEEGGFTSTADNVYLSVYGTLNKAYKRPGSPIVKIGSQWALREWYPEGVPEETPRTAGTWGLVEILPDDDDDKEEDQPMLIETTVP